MEMQKTSMEHAVESANEIATASVFVNAVKRIVKRKVEWSFVK